MAKRSNRGIRLRGTRQGGNAKGGLGCFLVMAGLFLLWLVKIIVEALIAVFSTPYPWLVLGLGIIGFAIYHGRRLLREQRLEKLYFDVILALHEDSKEAHDLVSRLAAEGAHQADALLLLAANSASHGYYDDALSTAILAYDRVSTLGVLSHGAGIDLKFPLLPLPIRFRDPSSAPGIQLVHGHLLTLAGHPAEALSRIDLQPGGPYYICGLSARAQALMSAEQPAAAADLLERAEPFWRTDPAIERTFRAQLAKALDAAGLKSRAVNHYKALLDEDDGTVRARIEEIHAAEEAAQRAAITKRDEAAFDHYLGKLEAARGPAGRRSALAAGLAALEQAHMRERLLLEASRIEVRAVLDKVDELKTSAAKRRHLLAALEAIRADDIPDDLQSQEIRLLEQTLEEIEGR